MVSSMLNSFMEEMLGSDLAAPLPQVSRLQEKHDHTWAANRMHIQMHCEIPATANQILEIRVPNAYQLHLGLGNLWQLLKRHVIAGYSALC